MLIWVEGSDDTLFFEQVAKPVLLEHFDKVEVREYAQLKPSEVNKFIRSLPYLNSDYMLVGDLDQKVRSEDARDALLNRFPAASEEKVIIVGVEIESWYFAGVTSKLSSKVKVKVPSATDQVTKEKFNRLIPKKYSSSRRDWLCMILSTFSIHAGRVRNKTFNEFSRGHLCPNAKCASVCRGSDCAFIK
jgi:hypothetical protein